MKFLLLLSIKNLFRYYKRTFITASAIAIGITILLYMAGILNWADKDSIKNIINYETGFIRLENPEYFKEKEFFPLDKNIEKSYLIEKKLNNLNLTYSKEVHFISSIINSITGESYNFIGIGISPDDLKNVYDFEKDIINGKFLSKEKNKIFISSYLSSLLDIKTGDELIIEANTKNGMHNADSFIVEGIFDSPNPVVNKINYYINYESANKFLDLKNTYTIISIKDSKTKNLYKKLKETFKDINIAILKWQNLAEDYIAISQSKKSSNSILLFFIFVIISVGIINTMLMAIFERKKEIGMMRALGLTKKDISFLFIFESAGIGFIGSTIGVIFGTIINLIFSHVGIDFGSFIGDIDYGYRVPAVFYSEVNLSMIISAFIFGIFISIIVSIYPSSKAGSLNITDALKD